jgi:(p)ppGpp synthase/HD superfamily hydrolase
MILDALNPATPDHHHPTPTKQPSFNEAARDRSKGVYIVGDGKPSTRVMFSYARCCNPVPGDAIVGIVTIGSGIKVHRSACHNVTNLQEKLRPRLVELGWSTSQDGQFLAAVKITGDDRPGMLNDITSAVIGVQKTNIRGVNIDAYDANFEGILTVYVTDTDHLQKIFDKLLKIKGVRTVDRFEG